MRRLRFSLHLFSICGAPLSSIVSVPALNLPSIKTVKHLIMKTRMGFLIGAAAAFVVGYGAGLYSGTHLSGVMHGVQDSPGQPRLAAEAQLDKARKEESALLSIYPVQSPQVQQARERVKAAEQRLAANSG